MLIAFVRQRSIMHIQIYKEGLCMDKWQFLREHMQLKDQELIDAVYKVSKIEQIKKGKQIIREGELQIEFMFLIQGVFRGYFFDINGKEITDCFGFECGDPIMSCHELGGVEKTTIVALTDIQVLKISVVSLQELLSRYQELTKLYIHLLVKALNRHWRIKEARYRLQAKERYLWFLDEYADLVPYVKKKDIASFLDLHQGSLCRVQRELLKEK